MKSNFHLNQINRIFDERRLRNHRIYVEKKNEVYSAIPEYMKLDKFVTDAADIDITAIINGDKNALSKTKESLKNIEQRKKQLLAEHGFPADYLEPVYTCPDCKDTGYIDNRRCHCFKSELLKILYKESNLDKRLALENFSTFDINRYSDDYIISDSDITPRENILKVLDTCKDFIHNFNNFPDERRNLLIYGNSGVGKTFLTNCIAKEILDKGYSVIYLTSYELFDILETKAFRNDEFDEFQDSILSMLYTCDLLIIDDLGTEIINRFTETKLFSCINDRQKNEVSTIISTNLSFNDITSNYSERIFSRLIGYYKLIKIVGNDLRINTATNKQ